MPVTPAFVDATTSQLARARPIRHRAMFGGLGIYLGDVFFAVADDDRLYFKVDGETVAQFEEQGMGPWMQGDQLVDTYREVPARILADVDALGDWIDASVAASSRLKRSPKKR